MFKFFKKLRWRQTEPAPAPQVPIAPSTFKQSLLSLEQRLMFDAAAAATAAEVTSEQVAQDQAEEAVSSEGTANEPTPEDQESQELLNAIASYAPGESTTEVVFVDPTVPDYESLIAGMGPNVEVVVLDATRDGVEQMAETLAGRTGIDAIHLISHGDAGTLQVGTGTLTTESMTGQYADELATIRQALSEQADILVYGCDFAEGDAGQAAVTRLAELTGADVQASDDATGHVSLGGDWTLETQTGAIETHIVVTDALQMDWVGLLDISTGLIGNWTFDTNATDSSGNNYDGTLTNGAAIDTTDATDIVGGAKLSLDGVNDYVDLSAHSANLAGFTQGTIAGWIKTTSTFETIFSISDTADTGSSAALFLGASGYLTYEVRENGVLQLAVYRSSATINDGNWHHVAVTVGASGNSLYVDGVLATAGQLTYDAGNATTQSFFSSVTSLDSMAIGRNQGSGGGTWYTNGAIDDVRVYDRVLTEGDIAQLYTTSNDAPTDITFDSEATTEQIINTYTTGDQIDPAIAAFGDGGYVVVWASNGQDGSGYGVYGQRYHADGTANGAEFLVTSETSDSESGPSVATFADGGFVVAWQDQQTGVYAWTEARVFNADGTAATAEFKVSPGTNGNAEGYQPSVLALDTNRFVVVWSNETGGTTYDLAGRIYNRSGVLQGSQFTIGSLQSGTALFGAQSELTLLNDGGFAATWRTWSTNDTHLRIMNSDGSARSADIALSGDHRSDVTTLRNGNVVVVYGSGTDILGRIYDSSGTLITGPFTVNTSTAGTQLEPTITYSDDGFVVAWESDTGDGSSTGIYAQRFDATGNRIDGETLVNTTISGAQAVPELIATRSGQVRMVWQSENVDGSGYAVVSRVVATGTASVAESAANGTRVADVLGVFDIDNGDTATYSLVDSAGGRFAVNATTGVITVANSSLLDYETNSSHQITVRATDGGGLTRDEILTISVTNVNDAPVLADMALTLTVAEDAGAPSGAVGSLISAFTGGITDVDSGAAKGIAITGTNETNGIWYYTTNGGSTWTVVGAVSSTSALLLADNGSTRLYFAPGADYNGTVSNAITVHAWDQTSGSNGARVSLPTSSNTVLDSMSSTSFSNNNGTANWSGSWIENDAAGSGATTGSIDITSGYLRFKPTTVGNSLAREVDLSTATSATFSFSVPTSFLTTGQILVQVSNNGGSSYTTLETITSASATGTHSYDISSYMASNTQIRFYASVADSGGIRIDDVQVQYSTGGSGGSTAYSTATDTIAVTVTAANDGPSFTSLNGTPTYTEGGSPIVLDNTVTITDTELTAANNFNGATLTLSRNGGASSQDVFSGSGTLSLSGGNVVVGGTTIGTYTNSSGTLAVTFNGSATNALVNSAMQQIAYSNSSDAPPSSVQVNWTFSDGNGGSQGTGGALSATGSVTVSITAVNDAPVLTDSGLTFTVLEDAGAPVNGTAVGVLLSTFTGNITDPDGAVAKGIAIVGSTETNGTWYYTTDAGATWLTVGAVSDSASLLLADTAGTRLYFAPNSNYTGNVFPGLIVRAWDQSSGVVGTKVDTTVQGGATAFSLVGDTIDPTVTAVNDPPVFGNLDGTPTFIEGGAAVVLDANVSIVDAELSALNNFNGATLTLARNGGANAEDVFSSSGTLSLSSGNVVVSGTTIGTYTNSGGTLQFTFNASATNTLVNSAMQQIAYSNSSDAPPASAQINWTFSDGNSGSQGSGGALTATGSTTVTITGVNDAPTITNLSGDSLTYSEGAGAVVIEQGANALVADIDSSNFDTGTLTISIPSGGDSGEDVLSIRNQGTGAGQIGVNGSSVTYGGVTIGTFTGGSNGSNLVITLNSSADATTVTALIKNITYENTDTAAPTTGARTVRYVLTDGDGGTSANYDATVTISAVNDAPTDLTLSANTVTENAANGTVVGTVTGTDPDTSDTKTYSFTDSAGGRFAVNSSTGAITVADGSLLNYEAATSHAVTVRVTDSGGLAYDEIFTINVTNVNDTPTGADATITINEDTVHTLTTAHFGFTDVDAGDSLSAVRIDTLPGAGTLTLSGVAVTTGQVITVADLMAGNVVFTPAADANGVGYASLTFSVRDSNNAYDAAPNTLTVDVTAVNDAPIRTAGTVSNLTLSEDAGLASLGLGGVTYSPGGGADESGQTLTYAVTAIPSASVGDVFLADGTTQVTIGSYTLADIQGMQFKPAANASGVTAFQFNVYDSGGTANGGANTISQFILITVTAVNDAPTITNLSSDSLSYNEGDGAVVIEQGGNALVADVDSSNLDTGTLVVSIPSGGDSAEDVLSIRNQGTSAGQIGVSGSTITYGGTTIGTFTGGSSGSNLVIMLNSNATPTAVTALIKNITYENTDTASPTTGARTVRYVLTDGDGGTSANYDTTVTVSGVNDAPVNAVPGAQTVIEDTPLAISGISVSDADGNLSTVQLAVGYGTLNVTLSGSASISAGSNGTNILTLSGSQADINATLATLVYQGTLNYNGSDTLTVTSIDTNSGTDVDTVAITVNAVNDAPVLITNEGATVDEGSSIVLSAKNLETVDIDNGAGQVLYTITALPINGKLLLKGTPLSEKDTFTQDDIDSGIVEYQHDGGETDSDSFAFVVDDGAGGSVSESTFKIEITPVNDAPTDLTLSANTVTENAANGTVVGTVTGTDPDTSDTKTYSFTDSAGGRFAVNSSTGEIAVADGSLLNYESATNHSVTVRVTDSGGLTYDETFTINLTNVNEAPLGADATVTITEDTAHTFTTANFGFSDVDAGDSLSAVRIDTIPSAGSLTLSGLAVTAGQVVTVADITAGNLVFTPAADANGAGYASLTFSVRDANNAYDSTPNTLTIDVTAVNDAPIVAINNGSTVAEGGTDTITSAELAASDVDNSDPQLAFSVGTGPAHGRLELTTAPGLSATSFTQADIVANRLVYVHDGSETLSDSFTFALSDGMGGSVGATTVTLTITPVNDAPTITSGGGGGTASINVAENVTGITVVVGADVDLPAQALTYGISGGIDQALFTIDGTTGALSFVASRDFEAAADANGDNVYVVQVRVTDSQGGAVTQTIQVTVTDVAEGLPPAPVVPPLPSSLIPVTPPPVVAPAPQTQELPASQAPQESVSSVTAPPRGIPTEQGFIGGHAEVRPSFTAPRMDDRSDGGERLKGPLVPRPDEGEPRNPFAIMPVELVTSEHPAGPEPPLSVSEILMTKLDEVALSLQEAVGVEQDQQALVAHVTAVTGVTLSVGFVAWAIRSGALLASCFATIPAWRTFDPLPVVSLSRSERARWGEHTDASMQAEEAEFEGIQDLLDAPPSPVSQSDLSKESGSSGTGGA